MDFRECGRRPRRLRRKILTSSPWALLLHTTTGALVVALVNGSSWDQNQPSYAGYDTHSSHTPMISDREDDYHSFPHAQTGEAEDPRAYQFQRPDQPPPPPPPRQIPGSAAFSRPSKYSPIHYEFKARTDDPEQGGEDIGDEAQSSKMQDRSSGRSNDSSSSKVETASPRRDIITRYMSSSFTRALYLRVNAGIVGAALGAFIFKSFFSSSSSRKDAAKASSSSSAMMTIPATWFIAFFILTYMRNPYGELIRALGMTLILVLRQSRQIRRRYPSLVHVKSSLGISARSNFPPTSRSPWAYQPRDDDDSDDPEFSMLYTLVAMAMVGSLVGGNLPLIPSWMGGLALACVLAFATTLNSARGDLARCMGMRVVAVGQEAWQLQSDLQLLSKFAVVSGKIADKLLILDRKHRIKHRVIAGVSFLYDQILKATQQRSEEEDTSLPSRRRPPPNDRGGRRRGEEDWESTTEEDWESTTPDSSFYDEAGRGRNERQPDFRGRRYDDRGASERNPRPDGYNREQGREPPIYHQVEDDYSDRARRR